MYQFEFTEAHDYSNGDESVSLPVELRSGTRILKMVASVDTGASFCIFGAEVAAMLDLELRNGLPKRFRTANSGFEAYGHEIEIFALGVSVVSIVYFFADPIIEKNVLGRTGWLDRVRLGLVHHDSMVYLAPYDVG